MDHQRFDALTRALCTVASRRGLGRVLAGGGRRTLFGSAIGLALWQDAGPPQLVAAKQCKKPKKKRKRKKCLRKAKETTPPPAPTCNDWIRNGTESDADCGGSCPRCAHGKRCLGRDDCIGALCINNVCMSCSAIGSECFSDAHGACACRNGIIGPVCTSSKPLAENVPLADCPPGTTAFDAGVEGIFCFGPCGGI